MAGSNRRTAAKGTRRARALVSACLFVPFAAVGTASLVDDGAPVRVHGRVVRDTTSPSAGPGSTTTTTQRAVAVRPAPVVPPPSASVPGPVGPAATAAPVEPAPPAPPPPPAPVVASGAADELVSLVNGLRASLGLPAYAVDPELGARATEWAASMAATGRMSHQADLSTGLTAPWVRLGENVGLGPDIGTIHGALVASAGHYANLTDPGFSAIGVGVVEAGGVLYVAEEFMQL
jgi:uncharacterized protein YkwD